MEPTLESRTLACLSRHPFLIEYGASYRILFSLGKDGEIAWAYNPANAHPYAGAIHFMLNKNIDLFFDLPGKIPDLAPPSLETLEAFYASDQWPDAPSFLSSFQGYPSKNVFENKFEDYHFTTRIPLSRLWLLRAGPDLLLGIIQFSDTIKNFLRWQNDWKSDINVLCDARGKIVGYDGKFTQAAGGQAAMLDKPLSLFLDMDAGEAEAAPPSPGKNETLMFDFPGKDAPPLEFNRPGLFSAIDRGLRCDAGKSLVPAFVKLPVRTDFDHFDYRVELSFSDAEKEPPVCILNGSDLIEGVFPDAYGLLFAPLFTGEAGNGRLSFVLKWGGEIISVFKDVRMEPEKTQTYTIRKQGRSFLFYVNGRFLGAHTAEDMPVKSGNDHVVFGLRAGNRAVFTAMKVVRTESSRDKGASVRKTAFFKNDPDKIYKVNSFFYTYGGLPVGLNYLRLEDLEAREKISRLLQTQKRQKAEIERLKKGLLVERTGMERIVGSSPAMEKVKTVLKMAAQSDAAVLLTGETGTGKSLFARVIHEISPRKSRPFVMVDCSALPESLIEAELFGFKKGAFTGAVHDTAGRFEQADGGTVFLDEIGNVPHHVQVKLLTVLQDLKIQPIGAARPVKVDVRIITATNADLPALVDSGAFRKDLFFRLNVIQVHLPPLRDMADDIPLLARHFLLFGFSQYPHRVKAVSPTAGEKMAAYGWPGNTRELYNTLLKSVVLADKDVLGPADILLPEGTAAVKAAAGVPGTPSAVKRNKRLPLNEITEAVRACRGNVRWAAHNLGLARFTLYNRLKKGGIRLDDLRSHLLP